MTAALALAGVAACGSSNSTGPDTVSLAGNYTLQSFSIGGQAAPQASGTLVLTDTHYTVNITGAGPQPITDAGTYTATKAGAFTQTSTTNSGLQSVGTYTLVNNLLTVNVTTQGQTIVQAWQKQ